MGGGENDGIRLTPKVGPFRDRRDVVATTPQLACDVIRPQLV